MSDREKLINEAATLGLTRVQAERLCDSYFAVDREVAARLNESDGSE